MQHYTNNYSLGLSAFLTVAFIALAPMGSLAVTPQVAWETQIEAERGDNELGPAAVSASDGALWVLTSRTRRGAVSGPPAVTLWRVSADGKSIGPIQLEGCPARPDGQAECPIVEDFTVLQSGALALVERSDKGQVSLLIVNAESGKMESANRIALTRPQDQIRKIIPTGDGNALLVGGGLGGALVMKVSPAAKLLWQAVLPQSEVSMFGDGVTMSDGRFVLTGKRKGSHTQTPDIWVGLFGGDGKLISSSSFAGVFAKIAKATQGGGCAIVYDTVVSNRKFDIWLRAYAGNLGLSSETRILSGIERTLPFKIAGLPSGGYVIAGVADWKPWISRVESNGAVVWSYDYGKVDASLRLARVLDALPDAHGVFVPLAISAVRGQALPHLTKVIKFTE